MQDRADSVYRPFSFFEQLLSDPKGQRPLPRDPLAQ